MNSEKRTLARSAGPGVVLGRSLADHFSPIFETHKARYLFALLDAILVGVKGDKPCASEQFLETMKCSSHLMIYESVEKGAI